MFYFLLFCFLFLFIYLNYNIKTYDINKMKIIAETCRIQSQGATACVMEMENDLIAH